LSLVNVLFIIADLHVTVIQGVATIMLARDDLEPARIGVACGVSACLEVRQAQVP
jgi:hypothetical protein